MTVALDELDLEEGSEWLTDSDDRDKVWSSSLSSTWDLYELYSASLTNEASLASSVRRSEISLALGGVSDGISLSKSLS